MYLKLTQIQRDEIKQLHRSCPKRKFADKLKALLLLDKEFSCVEVGDILLLDDDTIRTYRDQYLSWGAESLLKNNNKGTLPYLNTVQLKALEEHLTENTYSDSKSIVKWVVKKFNKTYTSSGINSLLKRLGFVYKKPVLTPCKANVEKQQEFIKEYKVLKDNLAENEQIYFVDGLHPQHNIIANYGWIKKGKTKLLKTNNRRKRTNINGAINLQTKPSVISRG